MPKPRRTPLPTPPRRRYPIGELRPAALARAREIVAKAGAAALTLRGLARDLGVSAPALLYYFGSRDGLRATVAAEVQRDLEALTRPQPRIGYAQEDSLATGERWIAFAVANPNLYRLAFGEGWRAPGIGWHPILTAHAQPTDPLEYKLRRALTRDAKWGHLATSPAAAVPRFFAAGVHGLASARLDGQDAASIGDALHLLARAIPPGRRAAAPD